MSNKFKNILLGISVTIGCAFTDMFVLYTIFINGNISSRDALISAVLGGIILDVPPYFIGYIAARKSDKYLNLKNDPRYKYSLLLLLIVIIIAFGVYLWIQIIMFIGAGDFNDGYKIFLSLFDSTINTGQEIFILAGDVSPGNAIQAVIPLVTSVISFVSGLVLYEKAIYELKRIVDRAKNNVKICEDKIKTAKSDFLIRANNAATKFNLQTHFTENFSPDEVITKLYAAYHKNSAVIYEISYKEYVKKIHALANQYIETAKTAVVALSPNSLTLQQYPLQPATIEQLSTLEKIDEEAVGKIYEEINKI